MHRIKTRQFVYDIQGNYLGEEVLGDDLLGELMGQELNGDEAILGAARAVLQRRNRGGQGDRGALATPSLLGGRLGVSGPARGRIPLGFGSLTCTDTVNTTGGTLTARPQVPWMGKKLIISISGPDNDLYGVTVRPTIGNRPVLAGAAAIDARSFPADALGNELIAETSGPGIDISLEFGIVGTIALGDSVIISPTWIGEAVV
jgi:hypothetical protein